MLTSSLGLLLLGFAIIVVGGTAAAVEAKHHLIGNALLNMKDSIALLFKLGKAVVSEQMEELTEDIIERQKQLALRTLQKDSQDIPGVISSVIGAIHSVTPYQKLDKDLTIPPVEIFPADIPKDIGVTIFPKPILEIPDVGSIPATERESNVIIENPPYIPKNIVDIFPEHVNEGEMIIRMEGGAGANEGGANPNELKEVFNTIKDSPNYPEGFEVKKGGTTVNKIKNTELLEKLKEVESGTWNKVYKDGYDAYGHKVSIHYFQSQSGKVFNVKVKPGWSN